MLTKLSVGIDKRDDDLKKKSGEEIRQFILAQIQEHPDDIAKVTAEAFEITRQAVHRHLSMLVKENQIEATGQTRRRRYILKVHKVEKVLALAENQDEDRVWRALVEPIPDWPAGKRAEDLPLQLHGDVQQRDRTLGRNVRGGQD